MVVKPPEDTIAPIFLRLTPFECRDSVMIAHGKPLINAHRQMAIVEEFRGLTPICSVFITGLPMPLQTAELGVTRARHCLHFVPAIHILPLLVLVSHSSQTTSPCDLLR